MPQLHYETPASNHTQETSDIMIVVNATINNAIQLLLYRENRRSDLRQQAALRRAQETPEQMQVLVFVYATIPLRNTTVFCTGKVDCPTHASEQAYVVHKRIVSRGIVCHCLCVRAI